MNKKLLYRLISYTICLALVIAPVNLLCNTEKYIYAEHDNEGANDQSDSDSSDNDTDSSKDDNSDDSSSSDNDSDNSSSDNDSDSSSEGDKDSEGDNSSTDTDGSSAENDGSSTDGDTEKDKKAENTDRSAPPKITTLSGIVMDIDTGTILYEKDIYTKRYPASITKIMTALIALENGNLNDTITVSANAVDNTPSDSSNIALDYDEQLSLRDAMYAMMLNSANDAAYAIAEHIAGSLPAFCDLMNKKAEELGCKNTHFSNASGLTATDHYTCPYDMALIARAAYSLSDFIEISSTLTYTIPPTNKNVERVLWHGDGMIFESSDYYYPYAVCGKTGYTEEANGTLVTFAEKDGTRLVSVLMDVLPASVTFSESATVLDFCFNSFHTFQPLANFSFEKEASDSAVLSNYYHNLSHTLPNLSTDTSYTLYTRNYINAENIERTVIMDNTSDSPVVGKIVFTFEGQTLGEVEIINNDYTKAPPEIKIEKNTIKKPKLEFHWYYLIILAIIIVLFVILFEVHMLQKRRTKRSKKVRSYPVELPKNKKESKDPETKNKTDAKTSKQVHQ